MTVIELGDALRPFEPGPTIPELLAAVNLEALMVRAGYVQGRNRQWPCPSPAHAQSGATPPVSLGHKNGRDVWCCHGCGAKGDAVDWIMHAADIDKSEAVRRLKDISNLHVLPAPTPRPKAAAQPLPDPDDGRFEGPEADEALARYIEGRGWNREVVDRFGLHAVRNRSQGLAIRHPYRTAGAATWWQDRGAGDTGPKWYSPAGVPRQCYARDLADLTRTIHDPAGPRTVLVVEGPADVIAMAHVDHELAERTIGIPGTEGANRWVPALAGLTALILTDPDDAGDRAATELGDAIASTGGTAHRLRPPCDLADWLKNDGPADVLNGLEQLANQADRGSR